VLSTGSAAPRAERGRADAILIPRGGPRPCGSYQVSRAQRCADRRFPRSLATVRGEGMRSNNPSQDQDGRTAMVVRLPDEPIACSCRLQHSPVVDLVGLKVPLDRVRVRGLLLQVGGSLRFPNRPTELQAMFGRFHRPEPWSPCLGPLAPCRLRPARPGLSGAARHQRSRYPGQPRQARSTSRAGPRHRRRSQSPLGWSRDGSVRSWVSVLAYCETPSYRWGGVRLGWHRQHPCLASRLHGRFASHSAGR
jgi:hypothetical protein